MTLKTTPYNPFDSQVAESKNLQRSVVNWLLFNHELDEAFQ